MERFHLKTKIELQALRCLGEVYEPDQDTVSLSHDTGEEGDVVNPKPRTTEKRSGRRRSIVKNDILRTGAFKMRDETKMTGACVCYSGYIARRGQRTPIDRPQSTTRSL